jgi:hypothetical protein
VHAYGAVSSEGASELYFATGTTGLKLGYKREARTKKEKAAAEAAEARGEEAVAADASGVGNAEYRDILGGTGAHASQPGLLNEMNVIFKALGRTWVWQQDGARAHTINKSTKMGKLTRQLILQHADELLDGWPALAADLTPIENIWALVEHCLWTKHCDWHDLSTFKISLRRAWSEITGNKDLLKRVCGSFEKRRVACIAARGEKIKY